MRDLHCHILPDVDDGSQSLEESLGMLKAAREAGVTEIVCTPHARDPYFDYDAMWDAYELLRPHAVEMGFEISMGFEVNIAKLWELGYDWIDYLAFDQSDEFLLELQTFATEADFREYERAIFEIQGRGYTVIIAHPERYRAVQQNIGIAEDLARQGCLLQASCDFIAGGRLGAEKKPAKRLFKEGLYTYIASDAHHESHYGMLAQALQQYGSQLSG